MGSRGISVEKLEGVATFYDPPWKMPRTGPLWSGCRYKVINELMVRVRMSTKNTGWIRPKVRPKKN